MLVLGSAAIALSAIVAMLSEILGFVLDPFYYVLGGAGLGLMVLGVWRKRGQQR